MFNIKRKMRRKPMQMFELYLNQIFKNIQTFSKIYINILQILKNLV